MNNYISTTEAAKILGVSTVTVFNIIKDGRIQAQKVGRNYIIDRDSLRLNFISELVDEILPILKKHGVTKAAVFGSLTRGSKKKSSDLDLLVEMKSKSLFDRVHLKQALEEVIKRKVDLGTFDAIYHRLRDQILNEAIYIL